MAEVPAEGSAATWNIAVIAAVLSFLLAGLGHLYLTPAPPRRRGPIVAAGLAVGVLLIVWAWLPFLISLLVALSAGAMIAAMVPYPPSAVSGTAGRYDWSTRGLFLLSLFAALYMLSMRFPPAMNWNIMVAIFAAFDAYSIGARGHGII